jgi:hypothetical protein
MSEEVERKEWLGCPNSVKTALPGKIEKAVQYALDECFLELVGTPEAQRDKWVYKEIKARIREAMQGWIKEAMDEAIEKALKK